jgi:hypothetical protein
VKSLFFSVIAVAGTLSLHPAPASAQSPAAKAIPRTADGKPDLSGVWQALGVSLTGETAAQPGGHIRPTQRAAEAPAVDRAKGLATTRPAAPHQRTARRSRARSSAQFMLLGVPAITMNPMPLQIVQTPKTTVILYVVMRAFRIFPTDRPNHPPDLDPTYMGDSIGHWDGGTFVVDVIGFNEKTWLDGAGHFHSDALHVVERYTRRPQDTIHYEATAEDPNVLTKPWKVVDT